MSPEECIAALDGALAEAGQDIVLRRVVGKSNFINVDVQCRAMVRAFRLKEEEQIAAVGQAVLLVSISPSEIARAQWPGGQLPESGVIDPRAPRRNDKAKIDGRFRNIEAVETIKIGAVAVRYNMQVLG